MQYYYLPKVGLLLSLTEEFTWKSIRLKYINYCSAVLDKEFIDSKLYYYLMSINFSAPRFYSQSQIHKLQVRK